MKQNSTFSCVKQNNNNSEGVDGNEQCSSNVKKAPDPKRTKFNSIARLEMWPHVSEIRVLFAWWPNSEWGNCFPEMQEQPSH